METQTDKIWLAIGLIFATPLGILLAGIVCVSAQWLISFPRRVPWEEENNSLKKELESTKLELIRTKSDLIKEKTDGQNLLKEYEEYVTKYRTLEGDHNVLNVKYAELSNKHNEAITYFGRGVKDYS